jgi:hypothetical protein
VYDIKFETSIKGREIVTLGVRISRLAPSFERGRAQSSDGFIHIQRERGTLLREYLTVSLQPGRPTGRLETDFN